jgi:hypothetical protein
MINADALVYTKRVNESGTVREAEIVNTGFAILHSHGTMADITLFVEDNRPREECARLFLQTLIAKVDEDQTNIPFVYVDSDTSGGLLELVGFEENPFCNDISEPESFGYEKRISWTKLVQFAKN